MSPPPPKRVRIATPMTPLNIWDAPLSPNRKLKKSFIRSSITENEIKHILEEMKCDPADDNEQCVENLIHSSWTPSPHFIRRIERMRATPIDHDDDSEEEEDRIIELKSGNKKYLSSRPIEELQQWLKQHRITYSPRDTKQVLVQLISRTFAITTPIRIMPKLKICGKSTRATRTRSVLKRRLIDGNKEFIQFNDLEESKEDASEDEEYKIERADEEEDEFRLRLVFNN